MLKGNNSLVLNTATMIEIVQYWIDNKALNKEETLPIVSNVEAASGGRYDDKGTFTVTLTEPPQYMPIGPGMAIPT